MQLTPPWPACVVAVRKLGAGAGGGVRVDPDAGPLRTRRTILPFILIGLSVAGHRHRRRQLPRRCTAVRRRRRWAVLRRCRTANSAEIAGWGYFRRACKAAKKSFITAAPACAISVRVEHVVFGESYLGYLSLILLLPFLAYGLFRRFLPERWALRCSSVRRRAGRHCCSARRFAQYDQMGMPAALPIRRPTSCSSPVLFRSSARSLPARMQISGRHFSARCCWRLEYS